ncbi:hypothetical protein [Pedobacter changchengzhani]|uniref:hypothetical protein n=1 Tax=Pedobacter changchengzhani TaxID=2529274 RepID=UPI0014044279|nr:hypothetical protein [Pedobacter changchengzhani]
MKKLIREIQSGNVPLHLKSLVKKEKPKFLVKTRESKLFSTERLQLDLFYKSPL